jgi:hypothetical protein
MRKEASLRKHGVTRPEECSELGRETSRKSSKKQAFPHSVLGIVETAQLYFLLS